jgi:hypothetical protein
MSVLIKATILSINGNDTRKHSSEAKHFLEGDDGICDKRMLNTCVLSSVRFLETLIGKEIIECTEEI